jgi:hypothetical protein
VHNRIIFNCSMRFCSNAVKFNPSLGTFICIVLHLFAGLFL